MGYVNDKSYRKNRLKALKKYDNKCYFCGEETNVVHHIDTLKSNHVTSNLLPLCSSCHPKLHHVIELYIFSVNGDQKLEVIAEKMDKRLLLLGVTENNLKVAKKIMKYHLQKELREQLDLLVGRKFSKLLEKIELWEPNRRTIRRNPIIFETLLNEIDKRPPGESIDRIKHLLAITSKQLKMLKSS